MRKPRRATWLTISSVLLAFAPKCPICFLAYFGIFGVATASASVYRVWLPPITAIWLALTIVMLAARKGGPRRYGPAALGIIAGVSVFTGKFVVNGDPMLYGGIAALAVAALWSSWYRRRGSHQRCDQCPASLSSERDARTGMSTELPTLGH